MEMFTDKDKRLPAQGIRTPRVRREGDIVPVPLSSSSDDGLPGVWKASAPGERTIADARGPRSSKGDGGRRLPADEAGPSTITSPPRKTRKRMVEGGARASPPWGGAVPPSGRAPFAPTTGWTERVARDALASLKKVAACAVRLTAGSEAPQSLKKMGAEFQKPLEAVKDGIDALCAIAQHPMLDGEMRLSIHSIEALRKEVADLKAKQERLKNEYGRLERKYSEARAALDQSRTGAGAVGGPPPAERRGGAQDGRTLARPEPVEVPWSQVVGRRSRRGAASGGAGARGRAVAPPSVARQRPAQTAGRGATGAVRPPPPVVPTGRSARGVRRVAPPRTAAVTITAVGEASYAEIMRTARSEVDLDDVGIKDMALKRAVNGGLLFEVSGEDGPAKADLLARFLEDALFGMARVARPVKCAEFRLTGLDDSVEVDDIRRRVCQVGDCAPDTLRLGKIRRAADGLGSVWIRCPVTALVRLEKAGTLDLGWTKARVRVLEGRPLQCYRCWRYGHAAAECRSTVCFAGRCFACGGDGHTAQGCTSRVRCTLCAADGRAADHRMGGMSCPVLAGTKGRRRRRRRRKKAGPRPVAPAAVDDGAAGVARYAPIGGGPDPARAALGRGVDRRPPAAAMPAVVVAPPPSGTAERVTPMEAEPRLPPEQDPFQLGMGDEDFEEDPVWVASYAGTP